MIGVKDLESIVTLALCSGYIKGDKPLSLLIISDRPEAGKTELVQRFSGTPHTVFASDISGFGLRKYLGKQIVTGETRHIVIPEMLQPLMKGKVTSQSFTTTLQVLMEDGVMGFYTGFMKPLTVGDGDKARTIGVIGCLPRPAYTKQLRREWMMSGFLSRWLVVTYKYSDDTVAKVIQSIERGDYISEGQLTKNLDGELIGIEIPGDVAKKCTALAMAIVDEAKKAGLAYGYREVKHIRTLVASSVIYDRISNGSERVTATMDDFKEVERLGYLFNEQFNEVKQ